MVIKRYQGGKNIKLKKVVNMSGEVCVMDIVIERPCSVLESIEKSFQEISEYKKGKRKLNSLEESMKLWSEWAEDDSR